MPVEPVLTIRHYDHGVVVGITCYVLSTDGAPGVYKVTS